uniref:Uncharacterized protein n=1 Tax=Timema douglasi TaxID=61478 RepID=A0A7R8Z8K5_TIMDO|nr:unnamed protein product [Timema douglasi]
MNGKRKPSPDFSFSSSSSSSPTLLSLTPLDVERAAGPVRRPSVVTGLKQKQSSRQGSPPAEPLTLTEYEPVYSPDGSSNASSEGPVYVRKPGFEHHAQEFERRPHGDHGGHRGKSAARTKKKRVVVCGPAEGRTNAGDGKTTGGEVPGSSKNKKKKAPSHPITPSSDITESGEIWQHLFVDVANSSFSPYPPSSDIAESEEIWQHLFLSPPLTTCSDPLPMRLRALPQSFWQQPNKPTSLSPGAIFPVLPPLKEDNVSADDGGSTHGEAQRSRRQVISVANTDLLFSLFREVEEEERTRQGEMRPTLVRRGRPKKPPSTIVARMLRDEDPCLVSTMTESILPLIPDRGGSGLTTGTSRLAQGQQVLAMVTLKDGDRSVCFPSLSVEHNYPQILSELVMKL